MSTEQTIDSAMIKDERVCIVPVGYDIATDGDPGCPIVEDANLPNPVTLDARYVLTNPFGINTPVDVVAQVKFNNAWGDPHFIYVSGNGGRGVGVSFIRGTGVVVRVGDQHVLSGDGGGAGHGFFGSNNSTSMPCRVYVTRGKQ